MRLRASSLLRLGRRLAHGSLSVARRLLVRPLGTVGRVLARPLGAAGRALARPVGAAGRALARPVRAVGRALARGPLGGLGRRLSRGPLGAVGRRLAGGRLGVVVGRLSRGQVAIVVAVAGAAMALGVATGSSDRSPKRPSATAVAAQPDSERLVAPETTALKRVAKRGDRRPRRGGREHYRRTARKRVPPKTARAFLPLYREAERVYGVRWQLIASIHRQETAFSTAPSTYHGLNDFGCCAGPMQFNVTNGPPSTWELYRRAFRDGRRPKRYPHRTRTHPSIYDDFDAIMAAGLLLSSSGAGGDLDHGDWSAAYAYYGHDLFGVDYASQVLARAEGWQVEGFCPNCPLDEGLVAQFDNAYGDAVREELLAAERRRRKEELDRKRARRDRHGRRKGRSKDRARRSKPPSARRNRPTRPSPPRPRRRRTGPEFSPPPPTPPQPSTTAPTTPPPPPTAECTPVTKLLGCRP